MKLKHFDMCLILTFQRNVWLSIFNKYLSTTPRKFQNRVAHGVFQKLLKMSLKSWFYTLTAKTKSFPQNCNWLPWQRQVINLTKMAVPEQEYYRFLAYFELL